MKKLTAVVLCIILIVNYGFLFWQMLPVYQYPFYPSRYTVLKDLFDQSQYVQAYNPNSIPDEYFYALAGWNYWHGQNPILFNAEQPPLGKYFISATLYLFNNENIVSPFFNLLCLGALFGLGLVFFKSWWWSLLMVTVFSLETLFMVQMKYTPLLDNIQLFFILMTQLFFTFWLKKKTSPIWLFLFLGMVISVKFWITGVVLMISYLLALFIVKEKRWRIFLLYSPITFIPLMLSYLPSFLMGDSLHRLLGVQKYIYVYHQGKFHFDPLALFDLLLFNRWHVGWEHTIKPSVDWQMTWPILVVLTAIFFVRLKIKHFQSPVEIMVIGCWVITYLVFLCFGTVITRYLIPVLPGMYLLSFYVIKEAYDAYMD